MKNIWKLLLLAAVILVAWFVFADGGERPGGDSAQERFERDGQDWVRYQDSEVGLLFEYRERPDGYVLEVFEGSDEDEQGPVRSFVLIDEDEYIALQNADGPREGPPSITVDVYFPGPNTTPNDWVVQNSRSNYRSGTALQTDLSVDGMPAVRYDWDGLYAGESVVTARKGWVYVYSVTFLDRQDMIVSDFEQLVQSAEILDIP